MIKRYFFLGWLFTFCFLTAWADNVSFVASAPNSVVVGEQFRLSYRITSTQVQDFNPGSIKGFDVLMGPSRSQQSSVQIINGKQSASGSVTFTYILMANAAGEFTIPGATIVANGKPMTSNALQIKVLPQDKASNRQASDGHNSVSVSDKDLFITASVNKTQVYEQEALLLTYKIYTRETNIQLNNAKLPDFKGFHSQEIEDGSTNRWEQEHYKGRNYFTTIYRKFVLFPQQAGQLVIEPAQFQMTVSKAQAVDDPFEAFFNGGGSVIEIRKNLLTAKTIVNVQTLPAGKPDDFTGGVGEFTLTSAVNADRLKTNDALTLKVTISGTGNLKLLNEPKLAFPNDFETYDPKSNNDGVRLTAQGLTGSKVVEYLAIPRHAGTFKVGGVSFSYFDLRSKTYKRLQIPEYSIVVEKGEGSAAQTVANFTNKEDLKVLGEDIRFIRRGSAHLYSANEIFVFSVGYWSLYGLSFLLFLCVCVYYRKLRWEATNVSAVRTRKANKMALKRMKLAGQLLKEGRQDAFYDEVLKTLWGYMSDKLNIPVSLLSKDNIEDTLKKHGTDDSLIAEIMGVLNQCEFARFAPGDAIQTMDAVYKSATELIDKMENTIKK
ncbi:MAG: BatD family protein [Bacteroides sp.]|nr:BatD family protein [Bacteroides sp.]